jgi:c-di-GMP phosphodiesterase
MRGSDIFVARQPIFDRNRRVKGYELLFRRGPRNVAEFSDARGATEHVISASYLDIGIQELTAGMPAFINFSRDLLIDGTPKMLQPEQVVVEILEDVIPDREVIRSVRELKGRGYRIALDDFNGDPAFNDLVPLVDIIKIDLVLSSRRDVVERLRRLRSAHSTPPTLLAEKVETHRQLDEASRHGFELFQGYFFSTPEILRSTRIPEAKVAHLKLLQTFQAPTLSYRQMEEIIKSDVALTAKLLKYINAAAFPWAGRVTSVRHALTCLGEMNIRKWVALVALTGMTQDKPRELAVASACRGRFCELAGDAVDPSHTELDHFLLGALSNVDAMLDVPMELVLGRLPISQEVKAALCGERSTLRDLLDVATLYERGDWSRLASLCRRLNLSESVLPFLYRDALLWSDRVLQS